MFSYQKDLDKELRENVYKDINKLENSFHVVQN